MGEAEGEEPITSIAASIGTAEAVQVFIADLGPAEQEAERYIDIAAIADDLDFPKRKKRRRPVSSPSLPPSLPPSLSYSPSYPTS